MAKESTIDLRAKVKVKVTEANPHAKTDSILEVHPIAAAKGVDKGHYEMVKDSKKKE